MKASFEQFRQQLGEIRAYLARNDELGRLAKQRKGAPKLLRQSVQKHLNEQKKFDYCLVVIWVAGSFEQYLKGLAHDFLDTAARHIPYEKLSEKIRENHVQMSSKILAEGLKRARVQDPQLGENELIRNLYACINGDAEYRLNKIAFTYQTTNFKHQALRDFFASIGIDNAALLKATECEVMRNWHNAVSEGSAERLAEKDAVIAKRTDGFIQRRNEVAHGVISDISELWGADELHEQLDFFEAYGAALYEIVFIKLLELLLENNRALSLGSPIQVFNNRIACLHVKNPGISIHMGDLMVAKTPESAYRWGKIEGMQMNKKRIPGISAGMSADIGFQLPSSFGAKDNQQFFVVQDLNDLAP